MSTIHSSQHTTFPPPSREYTHRAEIAFGRGHRAASGLDVRARACTLGESLARRICVLKASSSCSDWESVTEKTTTKPSPADKCLSPQSPLVARHNGSVMVMRAFRFLTRREARTLELVENICQSQNQPYLNSSWPAVSVMSRWIVVPSSISRALLYESSVAVKTSEASVGPQGNADNNTLSGTGSSSMKCYLCATSLYMHNYRM